MLSIGFFNLLFLFLIFLDAFIDILFKLSALDIRKLFQIKFKSISLTIYAVLNDIVDAYQLIS